MSDVSANSVLDEGLSRLAATGPDTSSRQDAA